MKAIILAGGKGSRLAPWHAPKCLLPINGVPMLHRLLRMLFGNTLVDDAVICTGYRAQDVRQSVCSLAQENLYGVEKPVEFSDAGEDSPMGARLLKVCEEQRGGLVGQVLICYGDELADVDINKLYAAHRERELTFAAYYAAIPGGSVMVGEIADNLRIDENRKHLVNIGYVLAEASAWEHLRPEDGVSDWINRIASDRVRRTNKGVEVLAQRVGMYLHGGRRATVNSLADLAHAEEVWK